MEMEDIQFGARDGLQNALVKWAAESRVVLRREFLCVGICDRQENTGSARFDRTARMSNFGLGNNVERAEKYLWILLLEAQYLFLRRQLLRHVPRIENRLDEVFSAIEAVADQLKRADLRRERVLLHLQLVPFGSRLWIRKVAHDFHDVGTIIVVEFERSPCMRLGVSQAEMMPQAEGR